MNHDGLRAAAPAQEHEPMSANRPSSILIAGFATVVVMATPFPSGAEGPTETREYKCFANLTDGSQTVVYYHDTFAMPERFADDEAIAKARIPDSLRQDMATIHECALRNLDFYDQAARSVEAQQPQ